MTQIIEDVETDEYEETDDPLHRTHIINPPDNLGIAPSGSSAQQIVDEARKQHKYVTALCGYRFIPAHNPDRYDACQPCFKVAEMIMRSHG